jgi:hypothetical protein
MMTSAVLLSCDSARSGSSGNVEEPSGERAGAGVCVCVSVCLCVCVFLCLCCAVNSYCLLRVDVSARSTRHPGSCLRVTGLSVGLALRLVEHPAAIAGDCPAAQGRADCKRPSSNQARCPVWHFLLPCQECVRQHPRSQGSRHRMCSHNAVCLLCQPPTQCT